MFTNSLNVCDVVSQRSSARAGSARVAARECVALPVDRRQRSAVRRVGNSTTKMPSTVSLFGNGFAPAGYRLY
jgi:hypothetical protein